MLAFLSPLPHPHNCHDYGRVGFLLDRALRSICNQTSDRFVVIVVCNRRPDISFHSPKIHWLEVGFPPASDSPGPLPDDDKLSGQLDKGCKLAAAFAAARRFHPTHVFPVDYDDLLHHRIAEHVLAHPSGNGWYLDSGYVYWEGSARIVPVRDFHEKCGSSSILACRRAPVPDSIHPDFSKARILNEIEEDLLYRHFCLHSTRVSYYRDRGHPLDPLPFPGAIWMRGTGENWSSYGGFPSILGHPVDGAIREAFQLDAPRRALWREAAASFQQSFGGLPAMVRRFGLLGALRHTLAAIPARLTGAIKGH